MKLMTPGQVIAPNQAVLVASGDTRHDANKSGWPAQADMETKLEAAFAAEGIELLRGHPVDDEKGHGFIDSQRMGMDVFAEIDPTAKVVAAEAVWQFSHHVLAGLQFHKGPILTCANWSGQAPGLVGMLNLNGSLTKMEVEYSTLWSEDFTDAFFETKLQEWISAGSIHHDSSHVRPYSPTEGRGKQIGEELAAKTLKRKAIFGVFDEGCMGMMNAIIDDYMLNKLGIFKERLSQSDLYAEMQKVSLDDAKAIYQWLLDRGMTFKLGTDANIELTEDQVLEQCRMYIAAVIMAEGFGCDAIGIQYQLGLADLCAASDLAEGLLNNPDRPPVFMDGVELFAGKAVPHFNEVDEGAGVDAYVTNEVWTALGWDPSTTLHDLRYGEEFDGEFVWVFLISGAAPASHFAGGYAGASSERQPPMYFRRGGGTLKGVSKPGDIVWSRVYVMDGALHADIGLGYVRKLPAEETERRWQMTTPQWPIMHGVLRGVSRDQMMGRHKSNHIQVVYAPDPTLGLQAKAAMFAALGIQVHLCGETE